MKEIHLRIVDWWEKDNEENFYNNFIVQILSKKYRVIYSKNPDYVIFGPFGLEHLNYKNAIRIFLSGENIRANWDVADYAVDYDYIDFLDRHLRYPLAFWNYDFCDIDSINKRNQFFKNKINFCSYMVSMPTKYSPRDDFFQKLCEYKKVDSGGRHLNNIGGPIGDRYNNFTKSKIEWLKSYKFNICFENAYHPGYVTEKIFQAFSAGCIPIYWGDPLICEIVNPKSFVNLNSFDNFNEAIDYIKEIDNDLEKFENMINEPVFIDNVDYVEFYNQEFEKFLLYIFNQNFEDAKRVFSHHEFIKRVENPCEIKLLEYLRYSKIIKQIKQIIKC